MFASAAWSGCLRTMRKTSPSGIKITSDGWKTKPREWNLFAWRDCRGRRDLKQTGIMTLVSLSHTKDHFTGESRTARSSGELWRTFEKGCLKLRHICTVRLFASPNTPFKDVEIATFYTVTNPPPFGNILRMKYWIHPRSWELVELNKSPHPMNGGGFKYLIRESIAAGNIYLCCYNKSTVLMLPLSCLHTSSSFIYFPFSTGHLSNRAPSRTSQRMKDE